MAYKYYRLNHSITSAEVRLIDEDGKQVGVVKTAEALSKARDADLDLVEIAPNAQPPVAKIIDFKKFKYELERKERESKKKLKEVEIKEVQMGPFVSDHDLEFRLSKTQEFLAKGNRIKITIKFTGRQMAHQEFGYQLIEKITEKLKDKIKLEREPKFAGRRLSIIVSPKT